MSNAIDCCNMCPKKDFRPISPEPGLLIGICSDHIAEYAGINCTLCGHHHHHPENQPACQEFHVLLTADPDEVITWDEVVAPAATVVPVAEDYEDEPCPGCGGAYDGYDYGGRGCSRVCAYGEPDDY
jgi:hypothetical protein